MPDVQTPLGGKFSPQDIARRRRLADAYRNAAISGTPQNLGEGLAAVGKALAARGINSGLDEQEASGRESADAVFRAMLEGERTEGPGGIDGRLFSAAQNPFLNDSQRSIVSAMMERDFGAQDRTAQNTEFDRRFGIEQGGRRELADIRATSAGQDPSTVQEWQFFSELSAEDQQRFLAMKRNPQFLNLGNQFLRPDALNPGQTIDARGVGVAPETKITDDRIITAPGVPGAVPSGFPGQPQGGAQPAPQSVPQGQPQSQQLNGPLIQNLPSSPEGVRRQAETQRLRSEKFNTVDSRFQQIQENLEGAFLPTTGFMGGQILSNFGGTAAHDISADLDTIKGIIGFGELQAMREASPTGGALGQVSEMENRLLQAQYGSLAQSQSEEQFRANLQTVRDTFYRVVHEGISEEEAIATLNQLNTGAQAPQQAQPAPQAADDDLINKYLGGP